ncbi:hypothetical protein OG389_03465 [Streptomyces sp. NBC_00435]|uniref:hypothetical protein n=1 Tax=Streptomyces sp. NBC_00435 TaxID=2903649 RepID=UPI002E1F07F8
MLETPGRGSTGDLPEWFAPPRMIGGLVTGPVVISRSDRLVVAVRQVLAYPVGLEIEVEAHARGASPGGASPGVPSPGVPSPGVPSSGGPSADATDLDLRELSQPLFRLRFADGSGVRQDDETGLRGGRGPVLVVNRFEGGSGGPDDGEDVRLSLWTWPLPPPGPVTVSCSWPRRGLQDAGVVLDVGADAIRSAALRAQPFWPQGF